MNALKTTTAAILLAALAALPAYAGNQTRQPAVLPTAAVEHTQLYVEVEGPLTRSMMYSDDLADAFYDLLQNQFDREDVKLELKQTSRGEKNELPALQIRILQWRTTRMGDIECRIAASYEDKNGNTNLGTFEGTTFAIMRSSAFRSLDAERAASDAIDRLLDALRDKKIL